MDFAKLGNNFKGLQDSVLELDKFKSSQFGSTFGNKDAIMRALEHQDIIFLRNLSVYYMGVSGIYQRLVEYVSSILTYDWYAYPVLKKESKVNTDKINEGMDKVLTFLDNMHLPTALADITRTIVIEGSFYGYLVHNSSKTNAAILELPSNYCRSRMFVNGMPAVEFNLKYFEDEFRDEDFRNSILDTFPKEFKDNYKRYKAGLIQVDPADRGVWFLCDTDFAMKYSITDNDVPLFAAVIPTILNLDEAKQLDLKKTTQELLKIIIQKMPLDKNGELIFDIEESLDMHNAASSMLENAVNVDILTTFADIAVADLDSSSVSSVRDPLAKVERGIFNEAGVSQNLFATDGNLSLEKSILNDEAIMFKLLESYQNRLNKVVEVLFSSREILFKMSMPHLSIYNIERKQKMFKDMATNGYSKLLPAITSGLSQTEFLALNHYEEEVLKLSEKLIPVQSSNTLSSKDKPGTTTGKVGAPEKEEDELSEKTIQNKESQS